MVYYHFPHPNYHLGGYAPLIGKQRISMPSGTILPPSHRRVKDVSFKRLSLAAVNTPLAESSNVKCFGKNT
jgi:hypothetical protein